ncbi:MAG: S8 family serine peptidase [Candidatus Thermoplasmatota archaeon]|nr:S8 family serine peptidase [Candidatus Thermoplasmatota archaeon]
MLLSIVAVISVLLGGVPQSSPDDPSNESPANSAILNVTDGGANMVVETDGLEAVQRVSDFALMHGIKVLFSDDSSGIMTVGSAGMDDRLVSSLAEVPGVLSISSEVKVHSLFTPNDPSISLRQWGLDTVNAFEAWDITRGTHDVVVGVLDTGIDWNHPDIAANMWNDSEGYHGYNFIAGNRIPMDDNTNGYDDLGKYVANTYTYHGTHVAGVIGAVANNNIGIAGMAQVLLMAVKVMNDSGEGTDSTVASGIRWAVDHGADVVTMSLGVDGASTVLRNAINYATGNGVVTVAASGNSGSSYISYPAAYPSVIAVGAIDSTNRRASFSNFGDGLDVMAPGVGIYSTRGGGDGYHDLSGTSTAAPYVAGVVALMLSVNPALTTAEVGSVINSTASDISMTGYDTATGWGIVDAFTAVNQIAGPTITITVSPDYVPLNGTFSISWLVSGGRPGAISRTYLTWGLSSGSLTQTSPDFSGTTWARFTVNDIKAPGYNSTIYMKAYAVVDGSLYESAMLDIPVHEAPPDGVFAQFLKDVQNFIFNDLGVFNFLLLLLVLIAVPAIVIAARPKRRRAQVKHVAPQTYFQPIQPASTAQYLPPPPPPPPRFEAYVDLLGHDVMPPVLKVVEGTKVVWVNRAWAPPPGIAIRSGKLDQAGEHPDGMFQSGLLIAPGDYWSATFHMVGEYQYYLTGVWKTARIIVEPYRPGVTYRAQAS